MLYQIGVVIVTVLALLKILSITVPALQTKKSYMKLVNYGFTDRVLLTLVIRYAELCSMLLLGSRVISTADLFAFLLSSKLSISSSSSSWRG